MPNSLQTTYSSAITQIIIELQPDVKQVDFNSKEIKDELEKVKEKIQTALENAVVDTQKLSFPFTV